MKRTALIAMSGLALAAVIASAACVPRAQDGAKPPVRPAASAPATITAVVLDSYESVAGPRTVWIVGLDGTVSTRTVPVAGWGDLALSPSGRLLLHSTDVGGGANPPRNLSVLDLDTGTDASFITSSEVQSYGWDSTSRVVALTGIATGHGGGVTSGAAGPRGGKIRGLNVWHGLPGSVASASAQATMPTDATDLVASDGRTAYLAGSSLVSPKTWPYARDVSHLWRYDFASHRLALVQSIAPPSGPLAPILHHLFVPPPSGPYHAPPYAWNLASLGLPMETDDYAPSYGGVKNYGPPPVELRQIDLLSYTDLKLARSVIVTRPGDPKLRSYSGPVFDATFSHYIYNEGSVDKTSGKFLRPRIMEVDASTGRQTVVEWPADQAVGLIGYLGSTRSFMFYSPDSKGGSIVLQEPGKMPRILLHLRGRYWKHSWGQLGFLGVQSAK